MKPSFNSFFKSCLQVMRLQSSASSHGSSSRPHSLAHPSRSRGREPEHTVYAVAYLEVLPGKEKQARHLIADYVAGAQARGRRLRSTRSVRNGYPDQFALIEQWQSQKATRRLQRRHARAAIPRRPRQDRRPPQLDERIQGPLFVETEKPAALPPIVVMTHIDIIPTALETATRPDQAAGRQQPAPERQCPLRRPGADQPPESHDTDRRLEVATRQECGERGAETVSYRHDLCPMSGSPYDERTYRPLARVKNPTVILRQLTRAASGRPGRRRPRYRQPRRQP